MVMLVVKEKLYSMGTMVGVPESGITWAHQGDAGGSQTKAVAAVNKKTPHH
jgi:hypothetical protein